MDPAGPTTLPTRLSRQLRLSLRSNSLSRIARSARARTTALPVAALAALRADLRRLRSNGPGFGAAGEDESASPPPSSASSSAGSSPGSSAEGMRPVGGEDGAGGGGSAGADGAATGDPVSDYLDPALFSPAVVAAMVAVPLLYPLSYIPVGVVFASAVVLVAYYAVLAAYAATEVAMRPPWYQPSPGLLMANLPPYWKGAIHDPAVDLGLPFTCVEFRTTSHTLRGWLVRSPAHPNSTRYVVCVHGAGRDRRNFLRHVPHLAATAHVLLFDTSEHGLSSITTPRGRGTSFGAREQHDIAAAVAYLRAAHGASSVAIVGTSTGAVAAVLAAAGPLADAPLACVVAENPFARADDLLVHHLSTALENYLALESLTRRRLRGALFWLASRVLLARMGQYWGSVGAADVAGLLRCPMLVAHSTADAVVPFAHGLEVYERAAAAASAAGRPQDARFFVMHDAAHCALYDRSPAEWVAAVVPFIEEAFNRMDGGCFTQFGPLTAVEAADVEEAEEAAAAARMDVDCDGAESALTGSASSLWSALRAGAVTGEGAPAASPFSTAMNELGGDGGGSIPEMVLGSNDH